MKNKFIIFLIALYLIFIPYSVLANTETSTAAIELQETTENNVIIPTEGSATVIENSVQTSDTREFFTIETPEGNIFYIVVDKKR